MSIAGKVVMLTGAAGTGKSTLAAECATQIRPLHKVDFGHLLLEAKRRQGYPDLTYDQLRTLSGSIITPEDVRAADSAFIESLPALRARINVLIDSHAVTRESYGYRITHYSFDNLRRISFDAIVITYCHPDAWLERVTQPSRTSRTLAVRGAEPQASSKSGRTQLRDRVRVPMLCPGHDFAVPGYVD